MVSSELQTLWGLNLLRVWQTTPNLTETIGRQFISSLFHVSSSEHFPQSGGSGQRAYVINISDVNTAAAYSKVTASSAVGLNTNRRSQLTIMSVCTQAEGGQARMDPDRRHSSVPYPCSFPGYITTEKQDTLMSQGWQELPEGLPAIFNIVLYCTRLILRKIGPIQLAFPLFIVCRIFLSSLTLAKYFFVSPTHSNNKYVQRMYRHSFLPLIRVWLSTWRLSRNSY